MPALPALLASPAAPLLMGEPALPAALAPEPPTGLCPALPVEPGGRSVPVPQAASAARMDVRNTALVFTGGDSMFSPDPWSSNEIMVNILYLPAFLGASPGFPGNYASFVAHARTYIGAQEALHCGCTAAREEAMLPFPKTKAFQP